MIFKDFLRVFYLLVTLTIEYFIKELQRNYVNN